MLSSVAASDMDIGGYQVSDLGDVEFFWEIDQLHVEPVFRPGIDTLFSRSAFEDLEMGVSAENPILLDGEEDKENSFPSTPVSERPAQAPALLRSRIIGARREYVPYYVFIILFQEETVCMCFNVKDN